MRSTPVPKLTRRTVKVALEARPFLEITIPSKAWMRSLTFSPSPSWRRTLTLTVSPVRNSGRSLRSCAAWSLRMTGCISYSLKTHSGGASSSRTNYNYTGKGRGWLAGARSRDAFLGDGGPLRFVADHPRGERLHFLKLGAELKEDQIDTGFFELAEPLGDLFG